MKKNCAIWYTKVKAMQLKAVQAMVQIEKDKKEKDRGDA